MADTKKRGTKKLGLQSNASFLGQHREYKVAMPMCQVPIEDSSGHTEYTTGPCQQAVFTNRALAHEWYKTCTHGPKMQQDGTPIAEHDRPYYETVIKTESRPVLDETGAITDWNKVQVYDAHLRIVGVAVATMIANGQGMANAINQGARDIAEFDIAPFCQYLGCWKQYTGVDESSPLTKFSNGEFCSRDHAALTKVGETEGLVVGISSYSAASKEKTDIRAKSLAAVDL